MIWDGGYPAAPTLFRVPPVPSYKPRNPYARIDAVPPSNLLRRFHHSSVFPNSLSAPTTGAQPAGRRPGLQAGRLAGCISVRPTNPLRSGMPLPFCITPWAQVACGAPMTTPNRPSSLNAAAKLGKISPN